MMVFWQHSNEAGISKAENSSDGVGRLEVGESEDWRSERRKTGGPRVGRLETTNSDERVGRLETKNSNDGAGSWRHGDDDQTT